MLASLYSSDAGWVQARGRNACKESRWAHSMRPSLQRPLATSAFFTLALYVVALILLEFAVDGEISSMAHTYSFGEKSGVGDDQTPLKD